LEDVGAGGQDPQWAVEPVEEEGVGEFENNIPTENYNNKEKVVPVLNKLSSML
jgi:hypothetical protein